jgi:transcriptional regulator GlxA family with amidase domain
MVLWEGVRILDLAGPLEVFGVADPAGDRYTILTASLGGRSVGTARGPTLGVDLALEDVSGDVDTLLVIGGVEYRAAAENPDLLAEVRRLAPCARRVASVCTGAFVLAAAGLLDGRRAATHWARCEEMSVSYPRITVDADAIFVRDGRVSTAAGVTAGIDLALAFVEEDHGIELARRTARALVVFMRRPAGHSQLSLRAEVTNVRNDTLRWVLDAVAADPSADHTASSMAALAGMSVRHFARLFTEQVGLTPARYVEKARVEAARSLLELGDDSLDLIASRCGFGSAETMRRTFLRVLGAPPGACRDRTADRARRPLSRQQQVTERVDPPVR